MSDESGPERKSDNAQAGCEMCGGRGEVYMSAPGTWTPCQCRRPFVIGVATVRLADPERKEVGHPLPRGT